MKSNASICGQQPSVFSFASVVLFLMAGLTVTPSPARADGCFVAAPFVWDKHKDINEPNQKAIIAYDAGREDLLLQVKYDGPVEEFGWLIPVPGLPTVRKGSMKCFYELSRYTQQHFEPPKYGRAATLGRSDAARAEPPEPVKVIEVKTVGAYEIAVLSTKTVGSLAAWLETNHFAFPRERAEAIDSYIKEQWYFVAAKIHLSGGNGFRILPWPPKQDSGAATGVRERLAKGELHPLHLSFDTAKCVFPLKISSINGTPSEVQVYVLSPEPLLEKGMFEKKFSEVHRLGLERAAQLAQMRKNQRERFRSMRLQRGLDAGEDFDLRGEANLSPRMPVPFEALLPYAAVTENELPECSRWIPRFQGQRWWLTKQTWTFQPEEMRDLRFEPAAPALLAEMAGEEGYYAAENLARLGAKAVPALLAAFASTNPAVRIHAASALVNGGPPDATARDARLLNHLTALFTDPEPEVRMDAASAAIWNWDPKFAEPLLRLLRDENDGVRHAAALALRSNYASTSEHRATLFTMLKDENPLARGAALNAMSAWYVAIPREDLLSMFEVPDLSAVSLAYSRLRQEGVSSQEAAPLLENPLPIARLLGLRILLENADKQSVELTIPLLKDPVKPVQARALALLHALTGQSIPRDQPEKWEQWWAAHKATFVVSKQPEEPRRPWTSMRP